MREEIIGGQRLICGDCLEVLPGLAAGSVDAVITDPPYGTGTTDWDVDPPAEAWAELRRLAPAGPIAVFAYPECHLRWAPFCAPLLPLRSIAWWHYNHPVRAQAMMREWQQVVIWGTSRKQLCGGDAIRQPYTAMPHIRRFMRMGKGPDPRGKTCSDVWRIAAPGAGFNSHLRQHPNEKPLECLERLVLLLTSPGQTVLDPYMGSGTTLVAAELAGRNGIGIELFDEHFSTACRRVEEAVKKREADAAQLTLDAMALA